MVVLILEKHGPHKEWVGTQEVQNVTTDRVPLLVIYGSLTYVTLLKHLPTQNERNHDITNNKRLIKTENGLNLPGTH